MAVLRKFCLLLAVALLAQAPPPALGQAQHIVSLNLCTDQLLLWLADKDRIASVTWLAADPDFSLVHEQTGGLYLNRVQAEEILALQPDLILASEFSASLTISLLRRLGHEVTVTGFPASLATTIAQIRQVAALLGESDRGEAMVADMNRRIDIALASLNPGAKPALAVFYASNGFTYGSHTLQDDFLQQMGLRNLAAEAGISGPGQLALETLLVAQPDYLLVNRKDRSEGNLAHLLLQHPALKKLLADSAVVEIPDTLFQCPGPQLATAFGLMAAALDPPQVREQP
ncbi:MAG: ABC transporter substrate-binding protein [Pseudomonadales bacterium]|nr:ABC transporter substrate-binding protein [Pseudomonadales bacterium]